jgi:hypothetical protein
VVNIAPWTVNAGDAQLAGSPTTGWLIPELQPVDDHIATCAFELQSTLVGAPHVQGEHIRESWAPS